MAKEASIRSKIAVAQAKLKRGTELIGSLADSNASDVSKHIWSLATLLRESVFGSGSFLVDGRAFEVFLVSCSRDVA